MSIFQPKQLGRQAHVLALLADGQRKLGVVDDDFELLLAQIGDAHPAHLGRLQRLFGESRDLFAELDDVDLLAAQFANDRLHAHALHAHAGADRIDILVARHDGDLGALAGFARDGANDHGAVVDLRHFALEEALHQLRHGAGNDHLGTLGGAVHAQQHHAHALADGELLQPRLFAPRHARFGLAQVEDHVLQLDAASPWRSGLRPVRWLYSLKTVSRSASRTFWKMTCLAICAAMRPSTSVGL